MLLYSSPGNDMKLIQLRGLGGTSLNGKKSPRPYFLLSYGTESALLLQSGARANHEHSSHKSNDNDYSTSNEIIRHLPVPCFL